MIVFKNFLRNKNTTSNLLHYISNAKFSVKKLPNLKKYIDVKFNFKGFINDLPMHVSNIKNRKVDADADSVCKLYKDYMQKTDDINLMRRQLNKMKDISSQLAKTGKATMQASKDSKKYNDDITNMQNELIEIEGSLMSAALRVPNNTHPDVPIGDETNAKIIKYVGEKVEFDYKPLDHLELGKKYDLFDFDNATKITGAKFVIMKNQAAILELAIINWAMDFVRRRGYTPIITPDISKNVLIEGCGFAPRDKSASQIYYLEGEELGLIATSEITCAGMFASEIINKKDLPKKFVCLSHCFRKEAGQGQHSKGLYRLHQFTKVEMFAFTEGSIEKSEEMHNEMLNIQEELYKSLGLHFKILDMPTEELGAAAYRKYDIEAYFPSKGYGEISSTSNCTDYQSLRLNCSYFDKNTEKKLMHTVNGTAVAIPRLIMAILENFQTKDKKIIIPKTLHPYTFGLETIE